jgi:hypothetical protein
VYIRGGYRASSRGVKNCVQSAREYLAVPHFAKPHPPNCHETTRNMEKSVELKFLLLVRFYS